LASASFWPCWRSISESLAFCSAHWLIRNWRFRQERDFVLAAASRESRKRDDVAASGRHGSGPANSRGLRNVRSSGSARHAAVLDDAAMLERNDPVRVAHDREPMSNDEHGPAGDLDRLYSEIVLLPI
jgi:hypothetical protein